MPVSTVYTPASWALGVPHEIHDHQSVVSRHTTSLFKAQGSDGRGFGVGYSAGIAATGQLTIVGRCRATESVAMLASLVWW